MLKFRSYNLKYCIEYGGLVSLNSFKTKLTFFPDLTWANHLGYIYHLNVVCHARHRDNL